MFIVGLVDEVIRSSLPGTIVGSLWGLFFRWVGVTRELLPCSLEGFSYSAVWILHYKRAKETFSYVASKENPEVFLSVTYRVTHPSGSNPVEKIGCLPYRSLGHDGEEKRRRFILRGAFMSHLKRTKKRNKTLR